MSDSGGSSVEQCVDLFWEEIVGMETENLTLTVPKDVLRKAELLAARCNVTLSCLVSQALEELLAHESYEIARRRHLALLEQGFDLGTGGNISVKRDELYER